jgi:hypothetical protein
MDALPGIREREGRNNLHEDRDQLKTLSDCSVSVIAPAKDVSARDDVENTPRRSHQPTTERALRPRGRAEIVPSGQHSNPKHTNQIRTPQLVVSGAARLERARKFANLPGKLPAFATASNAIQCGELIKDVNKRSNPSGAALAVPVAPKTIQGGSNTVPSKAKLRKSIRSSVTVGSSRKPTSTIRSGATNGAHTPSSANVANNLAQSESKRKQNDNSTNSHLQAWPASSSGSLQSRKTEGTILDQVQAIKRRRIDLERPMETNTRVVPNSSIESQQRIVPFAVMFPLSPELPPCNQDEWFGRLTPHGEDELNYRSSRREETLQQSGLPVETKTVEPVFIATQVPEDNCDRWRIGEAKPGVKW